MMEPIEGLARVVQAVTRTMSKKQHDLLTGEDFFDLSMSQIYFLELIAEMGSPTPSVLAAHLGHSKASVSAAISILKRGGYIKTVPSELDGRSYHIHLSEKGERVRRVHDQVHKDIAAFLVKGLTKEEKEQLLQLMQKAMPEVFEESAS